MRCNTLRCVCAGAEPSMWHLVCGKNVHSKRWEVEMAKETHCWGLSASNRHAIWNADTEIANLEKALAADGTHSIFAQTYWRRRLHEIHATPGLGTPQRIKLEKLLGILERHEGLQK